MSKVAMKPLRMRSDDATSTFQRSAPVVAFALALAGCGDKTAPVTEETPKPVASATTSASASAASVEPPPPPTFVLREMFKGELKGHSGVFDIAGTLVIGDATRVGKVVGDKLEWIKPIPEGNPAQGPTVLLWVGGRSLDAIDVFYRSDNGRWPAPTYSALTGTGNDIRVAPGGGWGHLQGTGYVGETTVVQGGDWADGQRIETARGPAIQRYTIPAASQGCKAEVFAKPAVSGWAFGSTGNGTLISVGDFCLDELPALEVWGPTDTKSKIIKIGKKSSKYFRSVVAAGPESAWLIPESGDILFYDKGEVSSLPVLEKRGHAWVGDDKILYATSETGVHKYVDKAWQLVGHLSWDLSLSTAVTHAGAIWVGSAGTVYRLEPGTSTAFTDECKTPFVMMYDVAPQSEPKFMFPTTRKALSTFKELADIELLEFVEGRRRLGIRVPSRAVGDAVIAHVKANMKDEKPRLICYAPTTKRVIPLTAAK